MSIVAVEGVQDKISSSQLADAVTVPAIPVTERITWEGGGVGLSCYRSVRLLISTSRYTEKA